MSFPRRSPIAKEKLNPNIQSPNQNRRNRASDSEFKNVFVNRINEEAPRYLGGRILKGLQRTADKDPVGKELFSWNVLKGHTLLVGALKKDLDH